VRLSVALIVLGLLGVVGGAVLIAWWVVGVAVIVDSVALVAFGLLRDDGTPKPDEMARRRAA
jgi:hypothetical protein